VPWLRRLAAGFPAWRPEFDPWSVHVGFVVDKVVLGQCFPEYFGLTLSISFRLYSVTRKRAKILTIIIIIIIIRRRRRRRRRSFIIRLQKKP
jgi:hypothetical protein